MAKIPMMVLNYAAIFSACIAAAMYFKPIGVEGNREVLESKYKEDLVAIRQNNQAMQQFLKDSQSNDPALMAKMDQVLRSGKGNRAAVPRSGAREISVGLDDDV
jgi:hypothetical protein